MPVSIGRPRSRKGRSQRVSDFDFRTWIRPWGFEYCLPSSRFWLRFSGYGVGRRWPVKGVGRHRQVNAATPARALATAPGHHRDRPFSGRETDSALLAIVDPNRSPPDGRHTLLPRRLATNSQLVLRHDGAMQEVTAP